MGDFLIKIWDTILALLPRFIMISPHERGVYKFFGKWTREVGPGLYLIWPWCVDMGYDVCAPRVCGYSSQSISTKDDVAVAVDSALAFHIQSATKALFNVDNYEDSLGNILQGEIERYITARTWEECKDTQAMGVEVLKAVRESARGWGLYIKDVYFTSFVKHKAIRLMGIEPMKGATTV